VFYYASSLYIIDIVKNIAIFIQTSAAAFDSAKIFTPDAQYVDIVLKLLLVLLVSSPLFRTTTAIEIKNAIANIPFASCISLTLNFIPEIFELWARIELSARARVKPRRLCGRLKKLKLVLTSLIGQSLYRASLKSKVLAARTTSISS
jgi:energy-coupling factor transporter transmembrane protein EcfT